MSFKVSGISATAFALKRIGDKVQRGQLQYMREVAEEIKDRAREYAPIDEGDLEEAIVVGPEGRDESRGNRVVIYIGVDPSLLGIGYWKYRFRYDEYVHQHMDSPDGKTTGMVPRGELTQAKGPEAGGRYLTRAFEDFEGQMIAEMQRIANAASRI